MTTIFRSRFLPMVLTLLVGSSATLEAQTCRGMPRGGGLALGYGKVYLGSTIGVAASKGPIAIGFNSLSSDTDVSGWDANLRFTLAMGSKIQICPTVGLDFMNQSFPLIDGSELTTRDLIGAAGVGVAIEQEVMKGVSIAPFVAVDYHFNAILYSLSNEGDDDELSGDTLSYVNIQYGASVRYKTFFAGLVVDRSASDEKGLYRSRAFLGLAFGGGSKPSRSTAAPRTPAIRGTDKK